MTTTSAAPSVPSTPAGANPSASAPPSQTAAPPLITTTANGANHSTKVDLQAVYQSVISGLLTYYEPTDTFQMAAGTYTRDELVAEFQAFVAAAQVTKASNQKWRSDVQTERALEAHVHELRQGVRGIAQARFGATGAQNLQFGFTLAKPAKKTAEAKAVAVAKGLATRKKRNTLGSSQKKAIKANVSVALVVTPAPGEAQPAASTTTTAVAHAATPGAQ